MSSFICDRQRGWRCLLGATLGITLCATLGQMACASEAINDTLTGSSILRRMVDTSKLQVVGGYYELASGRVMFSEPASSSPGGAKTQAPAPAAAKGPAVH